MKVTLGGLFLATIWALGFVAYSGKEFDPMRDDEFAFYVLALIVIVLILG